MPQVWVTVDFHIVPVCSIFVHAFYIKLMAGKQNKKKYDVKDGIGTGSSLVQGGAKSHYVGQNGVSQRESLPPGGSWGY